MKPLSDQNQNDFSPFSFSANILTETVNQRNERTKKECISVRFKLAFLSLLACVVLYITRVNLSVAIVAMSNNTESDNSGNNSSFYKPACSANGQSRWTNKSSVYSENSHEFNWSQTTQGIILGSFYYGYIVFQIIGGRMAEIFGAKWICGFGILFSGFINLVTPVVAKWNLYVFIGSRVLLGLVQSAVFPSFYALFIRWIPDNERSTYLPWLDTGVCLGTIISMAGSGELIKWGFMGGWSLVFYASGICAILWFIPWAIYARSDPRDHPWISDEELSHIIANTDEPQTSDKRPSIPWLQILKSRAFLSVAFAKYTLNFSYSLILNKLPSYLENVINYPIDENGLINSLISIGFAVTLLSGGYMSSLVIKHTKLKRTNVRKIFETMAGVSMTVCLAAIPLVGCNKLLVTALLFINTLMYGLTSGGDIPIITDMTSEYPATIFAVMNALASTNGFLTPWLIGVIIDSNPYSITLWSYTFFISSVLSMIGTLIFLICADASPQSWGRIKNGD